jgi:hypothetical protein
LLPSSNSRSTLPLACIGWSASEIETSSQTRRLKPRAAAAQVEALGEQGRTDVVDRHAHRHLHRHAREAAALDQLGLGRGQEAHRVHATHVEAAAAAPAVEAAHGGVLEQHVVVVELVRHHVALVEEQRDHEMVARDFDHLAGDRAERGDREPHVLTRVEVVHDSTAAARAVALAGKRPPGTFVPLPM